MNIDITKLQQDLIDYFTTAINPFDVDLKGIEEIYNLSEDKLISLATSNGFNIELYKIEEWKICFLRKNNLN